MEPPSELVHLISVMCESFLLGAYAILVGLICWILANGHRTMPKMHKVLFGASILMFAIATTHLGLTLQQFMSGIPPIGNFEAQIVLSTFQFVIGDLILIWRVWTIWGRNYWVAVGPLATMTAAAGLNFKLAADLKSRSFFTVVPVILVVVNTSVCTLLIVGRIWYLNRSLRKYTGRTTNTSNYTGIVSLIVESGFLYAASQITALILNHVKSPGGLSITENLIIPLIGILPSLIVVLVHFNMVPGTKTSRPRPRTINVGKTHITMTTVSSVTVDPETDVDRAVSTFASDKPMLDLRQPKNIYPV